MTAANTTKYADHVHALLGDFQDVEALLHGANAIIDRHFDDTDTDHIYANSLLLSVRDRLAVMRSKVDSSTFAYALKE